MKVLDLIIQKPWEDVVRDFYAANLPSNCRVEPSEASGVPRDLVRGRTRTLAG